jgi:hypothetical protein
VSSDCLFFASTELKKASEVITSTSMLRKVETACGWRRLREGPPLLKQQVMIQSRR